MNRSHGKDLVPVITLIRICYGRFNSFPGLYPPPCRGITGG